MLANPHLAPFEVVDRPCHQQDWTLIDHLMVIHRITERDYVQGDPHSSITKMARTLVLNYISEIKGSRCVVLVKDGSGAQKPAVREMRLCHTVEPHIEFCRRNLRTIEYTILMLLADMGMKNKVYLVVGSKGNASVSDILDGGSLDNVVSIHHNSHVVVSVTALEDGTPYAQEPSTLDPGYTAKLIDRPEGINGVLWQRVQITRIPVWLR